MPVPSALQKIIREEAAAYLEGKSFAEVAKAFGFSYARVRRHLKELLKEFDPKLAKQVEVKCSDNSVSRSKKGGDAYRSQFESNRRRAYKARIDQNSSS